MRVVCRRVVISEGLVPVALAFARACSAGPSPVWRIASVTRPRRSRGYRTERGLTAGRHHCGCALGHVGSQLEPGPRGPIKFVDLTGRELRRAASAQLTLIIRPVARSMLAGGVDAGRAADYRSCDSEAGGPGAGPGRTRSAGFKVFTGSVDSGHGSGPGSRGFVPVRRQPHGGPSAFPLIPASGVNRRLKPCTRLFSLC